MKFGIFTVNNEIYMESLLEELTKGSGKIFGVLSGGEFHSTSVKSLHPITGIWWVLDYTLMEATGGCLSDLVENLSNLSNSEFSNSPEAVEMVARLDRLTVCLRVALFSMIR